MVANLINLDLNLLVALDALLAERSVTRAAERLGVSQPAVSASLARLRRHFGDQLLQRNGNRYQLTALAQQLTTTTASALLGVQRVFDAAPVFEPATAEHEFTIIASDYATAVIGEHLSTLVNDHAPGIKLRFDSQTPYAVDHPQETLRSVDGMLLPHGFLTDVPMLGVWDDTWVCIVSADNHTIGDELTLEDLAQQPWVITYHRPTAFTPAVQQLRTIGVEPTIQIVVESFLAVPFLVAGTGRVALLQGHLARRMAEAAGIRILPCPWDVVPLKEAFWWHPSLHGDPAHTWLRMMLRKAGQALGRSAQSSR